MLSRHRDQPDFPVQTAVEGEVCLLRIHAIIVLVADGDLQQVLVPQLSGQFRPESGISSLVVAKFFTIQKHFTGVGSAVQLQEHSISGGFLHGQFPRIPAGAPVIIVAAVLSVNCVPGMGQRNRFQSGVPASAETPALLQYCDFTHWQDLLYAALFQTVHSALKLSFPRSASVH